MKRDIKHGCFTLNTKDECTKNGEGVVSVKMREGLKDNLRMIQDALAFPTHYFNIFMLPAISFILNRPLFPTIILSIMLSILMGS